MLEPSESSSEFAPCWREGNQGGQPRPSDGPAHQRRGRLAPWSQTFERTLADVFAVQDELARAIAGNLTQRVAAVSSGPLVQPPTGNVDAATLYLRGRYVRSLASLEGFQTAVDCFAQAVAMDPEYAVARAWLGYAYALLGFDEFGVMPPARAWRAQERRPIGRSSWTPRWATGTSEPCAPCS